MFSFYGALIGIALVIFIDYFQKYNHLIPKNKEKMFLFTLIISSFLGARLFYVLTHLSYYISNPNQIFNTRAGGMGIFGGIIIAVTYIYFSTKSKFIKFTDSFITIIPLCQSIGRVGNIINREIYPVCIYEMFLDFTLFLILLKTKKNKTAIFIIGYSFIRLILEQFRTDALPYHLGSIFSLLGIIIGIIIFKKKK